jgi:hypothetical protein
VLCLQIENNIEEKSKILSELEEAKQQIKKLSEAPSP